MDHSANPENFQNINEHESTSSTCDQSKTMHRSLFKVPKEYQGPFDEKTNEGYSQKAELCHKSADLAMVSICNKIGATALYIANKLHSRSISLGLAEEQKKKKNDFLHTQSMPEQLQGVQVNNCGKHLTHSQLSSEGQPEIVFSNKVDLVGKHCPNMHAGQRRHVNNNRSLGLKMSQTPLETTKSEEFSNDVVTNNNLQYAPKIDLPTFTEVIPSIQQRPFICQSQKQALNGAVQTDLIYYNQHNQVVSNISCATYPDSKIIQCHLELPPDVNALNSLWINDTYNKQYKCKTKVLCASCGYLRFYEDWLQCCENMHSKGTKQLDHLSSSSLCKNKVPEEDCKSNTSSNSSKSVSICSLTDSETSSDSHEISTFSDTSDSSIEHVDDTQTNPNNVKIETFIHEQSRKRRTSHKREKNECSMEEIVEGGFSVGIGRDIGREQVLHTMKPPSIFSGKPLNREKNAHSIEEKVEGRVSVGIGRDIKQREQVLHTMKPHGTFSGVPHNQEKNAHSIEEKVEPCVSVCIGREQVSHTMKPPGTYSGIAKRLSKKESQTTITGQRNMIEPRAMTNKNAVLSTVTKPMPIRQITPPNNLATHHKSRTIIRKKFHKLPSLYCIPEVKSSAEEISNSSDKMNKISETESAIHEVQSLHYSSSFNHQIQHNDEVGYYVHEQHKQLQEVNGVYVPMGMHVKQMTSQNHSLENYPADSRHAKHTCNDNLPYEQLQPVYNVEEDKTLNEELEKKLRFIKKKHNINDNLHSMTASELLSIAQSTVEILSNTSPSMSTPTNSTTNIHTLNYYERSGNPRSYQYSNQQETATNPHGLSNECHSEFDLSLLGTASSASLKTTFINPWVNDSDSLYKGSTLSIELSKESIPLPVSDMSDVSFNSDVSNASSVGSMLCNVENDSSDSSTYSDSENESSIGVLPRNSYVTIDAKTTHKAHNVSVCHHQCACTVPKHASQSHENKFRYQRQLHTNSNIDESDCCHRQTGMPKRDVIWYRIVNETTSCPQKSSKRCMIYKCKPMVIGEDMGQEPHTWTLQNTIWDHQSRTSQRSKTPNWKKLAPTANMLQSLCKNDEPRSTEAWKGSMDSVPDGKTKKRSEIKRIRAAKACIKKLQKDFGALDSSVTSLSSDQSSTSS